MFQVYLLINLKHFYSVWVKFSLKGENRCEAGFFNLDKSLKIENKSIFNIIEASDELKTKYKRDEALKKLKI